MCISIPLLGYLLININEQDFRDLLEHRFSNRQIEAAADALIQEHGNRAVIVAANRAKTLNSEGHSALAEMWLKIREKIIVKERLRRMTS